MPRNCSTICSVTTVTNETIDSATAWARLAEQGIEVDTSGRRRWEYSYDASNYRIRPAAVAFPRSAADVQALLAVCRETGVPVTSRGGGTSMGGNSIGAGLVLDFSRYMRGVGEIEFDAAGEASAWVEAGAVLSELRGQLERASGGSLTFAPDPSSHTRATLGGSYGNDACGNHSVAYGRTSHHVIEAEVITADGARLIAGPGGVRPVDDEDAASRARADELNDRLRALADAHLAAFRTELQTIPRQVSGYHLGHLLPEEGLDVAAALAGSEGTCATSCRRSGPSPQRSRGSTRRSSTSCGADAGPRAWTRCPRARRM